MQVWCGSFRLPYVAVAAGEACHPTGFTWSCRVGRGAINLREQVFPCCPATFLGRTEPVAEVSDEIANPKRQQRELHRYWQETRNPIAMLPRLQRQGFFSVVVLGHEGPLGVSGHYIDKEVFRVVGG